MVWLFRILFPLPESTNPDARSLEEQARNYKKYELISLPILFGAIPLLTYLCWWVVISFRPPPFSLAADGTYSISALHISFVVPILFGAFAAAIPTCEFVLRLFLKERYPEYLAYGNRKHGFDSLRAGRFMLIGTWTLSAAVMALLCNWYFVVAANEVRANGLFSISETRYSYDDITAIHSAPRFVAPNGKPVVRDVYSIQFADGNSWFSNASPCSSSFDTFTPMVQTVSERSGVPITKLQLMSKWNQ